MHSSTIEHELNAVRAIEVRVTDETISVDLEDGRTVVVPTAWVPRLIHADSKERANVSIQPGGIEWPEIEADVSIRGLLLGRRSGENPESFNYWLENRKQGRKVTVMDWLATREKQPNA